MEFVLILEPEVKAERLELGKAKETLESMVEFARVFTLFQPLQYFTENQARKSLSLFWFSLSLACTH